MDKISALGVNVIHSRTVSETYRTVNVDSSDSLALDGSLRIHSRGSLQADIFTRASRSSSRQISLGGLSR
eukprot:5357873-Prymnesium_polylepis.1